MRVHKLSPLLWCYGDPHGPRPGRFTFVLAPFAGGNAYSFARWIPELIGPGDNAIVLQYPGRGPRVTDPMPETLASLADQATDELTRQNLGLPVLMGHSMGGVLAYEIAVRAEERGRRIELLAVSAARPPALTDMDPDRILAMRTRDWLTQLNDDGFIDSGILANPELLNLTIRVLRADSLLLARHQAHGRTVRCRTLGLGGSDDPGITGDHIAAWCSLTTGSFTTRLWPGAHFYYRDKLPRVTSFVRGALTPRITT